jgi:hypothetical protein
MNIDFNIKNNSAERSTLSETLKVKFMISDDFTP